MNYHKHITFLFPTSCAMCMHHYFKETTLTSKLVLKDMSVCLVGITAASGISAELGIPLTHRGVATSVRFLTGHSRKGGTDPLYVAENAADPDSTLVVYMGLSTLPSLALKLMQHGLPPDTPAAAVERGTTPQQRTVSTILCCLQLLSWVGIIYSHHQKV